MTEEQNWQQLFKTFFGDLLEHLVPEWRGDLEFGGAVCLELDSLRLNLTGGHDGREDMHEGGFLMVAEVPHRRHGDCLVLLQAEMRVRPRSQVETWLERSYRKLLLALERPVLPIVLFMAEAEPALESRAAGRRCLVRGDAGVTIFRLDYRTFHLPRARAETHFARSPLAPALASRMGSQLWNLAQLKLECMAAVLGSELDDGIQRSMLRLIESPSQPGRFPEERRRMPDRICLADSGEIVTDLLQSSRVHSKIDYP